jgi:hypothetical protein
MTRKPPLLSSSELDLYQSHDKKRKNLEAKQFTKDYIYAIILAPLCMIIIYILYVLVWSVFSI